MLDRAIRKPATDLESLVLEVQRELRDPDPDVIVAEVFSRLSPADYQDAINRLLLPHADGVTAQDVTFAAQYEAWAEVVTSHGVATFQDLPEDVRAALLADQV